MAFSHEQAAAKMKISRATFGRIVEAARNKVVDAILHGKAIRIGNEFPEELKGKQAMRCKNCGLKINIDSTNKTISASERKNKQGETK
jgi:hypothetical protein